MNMDKERQEAEELLAKLPQQDILALAGSLTAIVNAQVAAGKKLTAEEAAILERANGRLTPRNH